MFEEDIAPTSVILRGRISDDAGDPSCWYRFRYFKEVDGFTAGVRTEELPLETVNGQGEFAQLLEGLDPNCTYRFQAEAGNALDSDIGQYKAFTTKPLILSPLDILYVDDNAASDPGPNDVGVSDPNEDGSQAHPFDAIQEAIDVARNGVTIWVVQGSYVESLNFKGKSIEVNGLELANQGKTRLPRIDGANLGTVATFDQGEDANSVLAGFVLTGGYGDLAGAIACIGSSPTIRNCLIVGNRCMDDPVLSVPVQGALYFENSHSLIENCTIADNYGIGICIRDCDLIVSNSIIWGNTPNEIEVISGNAPILVHSSVDADPLFPMPGYWADANDPIAGPVDPGHPGTAWLAGDYHLMSRWGRYDADLGYWVTSDWVTSPCIDMGNPMDPVGYESDDNGGRINAGAYGGTWMASRSEWLL